MIRKYELVCTAGHRRTLRCTPEEFVNSPDVCHCGAELRRHIEADPWEAPLRKHSTLGGWPRLSDALACNPRQVKKFESYLKAKGVPTKFDRTGRCEVRSPGHQKAILKARGMVDFD